MSAHTESGYNLSISGYLLPNMPDSIPEADDDFKDMTQVFQVATRRVRNLLNQLPEDGVFDSNSLAQELIRTIVNIADEAYEMGTKNGQAIQVDCEQYTQGIGYDK